MRGHDVPDEVALALQRRLDQINQDDPVAHHPMWQLALFRHPCPKARQSLQLAGKGVSTAIDLKERYLVVAEAFPDDQQLLALDPDGAYALLFREGTCNRCKAKARSTIGCAVEIAKRPPISGRVARA